VDNDEKKSQSRTMRELAFSQRAKAGQSYIYRDAYSTNEEVAFIRGLATGKARTVHAACTYGWAGKGPNRKAFEAYAQIVMDDMRSYGPGVNVGRVKEAITELLTEIEA
jgi:hypothetical protein